MEEIRITEEQRQKLHSEKYAVEILCSRMGTVLIVGDEVYQFATDLFLAANKDGRTLNFSMDVDAFAQEFIGPDRGQGQ